MTDGAVHREPDPAEVEAFWNLARFQAKLNSVPSYFGPTTLETVPPPVWALGETAAEADDLVGRLLADRAAELSARPSDFADGVLPEVGALGIVADGAGRPRVLVSTAAVEVSDQVVTERLTVVWAPAR